jgi:hypothetical protein
MAAATSLVSEIADQYVNGVKNNSYHDSHQGSNAKPVGAIYHSTMPTNNTGKEYELWITMTWRIDLGGETGTARCDVYFEYTAS